MTKLVIDLCAGLGGFSSAFTTEDYWVVTVEIEKRFKPTILADVRYLPFRENLQPDVLLASPPCNSFSVACPQFPRKGIMKSLEIVGACLEAVVFLKPKKWLVENPRGRLRQFLGKPKQTIRYSDYDKEIKLMKTTDFWGNIFLPMVKGERRIYHNSGFKESNDIRRLKFNFPLDPKLSAERAKIPIGVSQAIMEACLS